MTWAKQPCRNCKVIIYWNSQDKTMKETGSWHEFDTNLLHDYNRCKQQQRDTKEADEFLNVLLTEKDRKFLL